MNPSIEDQVRDGLTALQTLWALYRDEADSAQWSRRTDMPTVSTSTTSDPTGTVAATRQRERRANAIADDITWIVNKLQDKVDRYRPKQTGPCLTDGCIREGITTWNGRCEKCGPWTDANPGFDPAEQTDPETGRSLVDDWNAQAIRDCGCPDWCCPDGCTDRIRPTGSNARVEQPISARCRKRMQRSRDIADAS